MPARESGRLPVPGQRFAADHRSGALCKAVSVPVDRGSTSGVEPEFQVWESALQRNDHIGIIAGATDRVEIGDIDPGERMERQQPV